MTIWLMSAMTFVAFLMLNAWFSERRLVISRTGDIFMLAWFYYGFAVAIDILLGFEIEGIIELTNFSDQASRELLVQVLGQYLLCGGAFFLMYSMTEKAPRSARSGRSFVLPPLPLVIAAHVVLLLMVADSGYLSLTRPQRELLVSESMSMRLMGHAMSILRAVDLVVIILSNRRTTVIATTVAAICLGLISGGRMEIMSVLLILVLKYRLSSGRFRFAVTAVLMLAVLASWKSAYRYVYSEVFEYGANRNVLEYANTSLSEIDSLASSLIAVTVLEDKCPYLLGKTYTYDVLQLALPREWRDPDFLPLSQQFNWDYIPQRAEQGVSMAFSGIAESWLNFGMLGPVLLGFAFGIAAKRIDSGPRGVVFYVFALMVFRVFRSDFASLSKSWIIIYGGAMVTCYFVSMVMTYLVGSQRSAKPALRRQRRPTPLAGRAITNYDT